MKSLGVLELTLNPAGVKRNVCVAYAYCPVSVVETCTVVLLC